MVSNTNQTAVDSQFLFDMVAERYGERLTPEELEEVRKGVEAMQKAAETLRSVKLENSDEPMGLFIPYRKEGESNDA